MKILLLSVLMLTGCASQSMVKDADQCGFTCHEHCLKLKHCPKA